MKKCTNSVTCHKLFEEKYGNLLQMMSALKDRVQDKYKTPTSHDDITQQINYIGTLMAEKHNLTSMLHATQEVGEKLMTVSSPEGKEHIRSRLSDIQVATDKFFDDFAKIQRELQMKLCKWESFEECSKQFRDWMATAEEQIQGDLILKTTLDDKKGQLQTYRNILQDVKSHKPVFDDIVEKAEGLPEGSSVVTREMEQLQKDYQDLQAKSSKFVEAYEAIVADHHSYMKAVMEFNDWLNASLNTIDMWGDTTLERLSLHANLERLKNLQLTLPEEEHRKCAIKDWGEKVLPGTVSCGHINIKAQIDATDQDWNNLVSVMTTYIQGLEGKIKQWDEFEAMKEECMMWLKETDTKLHTFNLSGNIQDKIEKLETLKDLQTQIRAKEFEVDAVTERAQQLTKGVQVMRSSLLTEITAKYQHLSVKVKDLLAKWQQNVATHNEFEHHIDKARQWISHKITNLSKVEGMTVSEPSDVNEKVKGFTEIILSKDEGFAVVQKSIELGQGVLANTSPEGHDKIKQDIDNLQNMWTKFVKDMAEAKHSMDETMKKWNGLQDTVNVLQKSFQGLSDTFKEICDADETVIDTRSKMEKLRSLDEKLKCDMQDAEQVKQIAQELQRKGYSNDPSVGSLKICDQFVQLSKSVKGKLEECEGHLKDYKLYKVALESLGQYLQRCKDKLHTMKQRSPNDKNYVDAVTQALDHLLNKEAQGQILVEQVQQTGEVLLKTTSGNARSILQKDIAASVQSFGDLFEDIKRHREQMGLIMSVFRDFKDETERLNDWMQQADINVKAAKTSLLATLDEKEKAVRDMQDLHKKLLAGKKDIQRYKDMAKQMKNSCLEVNVMTQLQDICHKFDTTCKFASDVLNKMTNYYDHHFEFDKNQDAARDWIESAWNVIRTNTATEGKTKENLYEQLDKIRALIQSQEEGQKYVHAAIDWGEKTIRNTRSDGREKITQAMKEIQTDWEKLCKKMSTAKVSVETDLLQWSDAQQSVSRLQEWINERENRLKQASQCRHVMITRRSTLGITTLSVSERTAALRKTNNILQDIQAFEPMIQSVASSTSSAASPVTDIKTKYNNLSKQAQELYDKEKAMVEKHEHFMEAGHSFMNWLRVVKDKLSRCSEPTGDKESLAGKIAQLKIIEGAIEEGEQKLEEALRTAAEACSIALEDDKDIVEEEVAFLQDEYDQFSEQLVKVKKNLEGGIVRWTDYQEMHQEAADFLSKTEETVKSYTAFKESLPEKREALEKFQIELQRIFDWQKDLDTLNKKGQKLLETCADSRVSNSITHLSTKYQALISLAKEVMRQLEMYFQEHHQHNALCQDCQAFIDSTRDKLNSCKTAENTHEAIQERLKDLKSIRQSLDHGQNKLRYALELKERVVLNTKPSGAEKIEKDTMKLKEDFDKLTGEMQEVKVNLSNRFDLLGDIEKSNKLLMEWIQETESKVQYDNQPYNTLGEKRAHLEKNVTILKELESHKPTVDKLEQKLEEHPNIPNEVFNECISRFKKLTALVESSLGVLKEAVQNHEKYDIASRRAYDWIANIKLKLQRDSDSHGSKEEVLERQGKLQAICSNLKEEESLMNDILQLNPQVLESTGEEGKDIIKHDTHQIKYDLEQVKQQARQSKKTIDKTIAAWEDFENSLESFSKWLKEFKTNVDNEGNSQASNLDDLERRRELLKEANKQKYEMESLHDKCEILMELSGYSPVRDQTVNIQAMYSSLYTTLQGLLSKTERSVSDFSGFYQSKEDFETWYQKASGMLKDDMDSGNSKPVSERIDNVKSTMARLSEGQHLLNCVTEVFSQIAGNAPGEKQNEMQKNIKAMSANFSDLSNKVNEAMLALHSQQQRSSDLKSDLEDAVKWTESKKESISSGFNSTGELGDLKTREEEITSLRKEIEKKRTALNSLENDLSELVAVEKDQSLHDQLLSVVGNMNELDNLCLTHLEQIQKEIGEYNAYNLAMQDTEKWLLQMSFQLMAHNSLYISTREQTSELIGQHDKLMDSIKDYQPVLAEVKDKGLGQIAKYSSVRPEIRPMIERQHQNFQESYNSLLQTATQIRNRLLDSLAKFQEYEDALDAILQNISVMEPQILQDIQEPVECISNIHEEFEKLTVSTFI